MGELTREQVEAIRDAAEGLRAHDEADYPIAETTARALQRLFPAAFIQRADDPPSIPDEPGQCQCYRGGRDRCLLGVQHEGAHRYEPEPAPVQPAGEPSERETMRNERNPNA